MDTDAEHLPLQPALEAVLLTADEPVDHIRLAQTVGRPPQEVHAALQALAQDYDDQHRGFALREVARGWRLYTRDEFASAVERFVSDDRPGKLSQAALETLAIVAYQQPISRSRISAVRGVSVDAVVRNLVLRGMLDECGTDPESGAVLYATSALFLEHVGLQDLSELPDLAPLLPGIDELGDGMPAEHAAGPAAAEDSGGE